MKNKNRMIVFAILFLILIIAVYFVHKSMAERKIKHKEPEEIEQTDFNLIDEETGEYSETEIGIYSINYDNQECEPSVIVVPKEKKVDESYIVEEVIANFNEEVIVEKIDNKDGDITVVFEKNSAPACNVSGTMEELILNCISFSLLDNIDKCRNIYFMIGNEPYNGVSITLASDEPYISLDVSEDENE